MKMQTYLVITTLVFFSCNSQDQYIQNVYVNIELDLNLPEFSELNTNGNAVFIDGGVEGIIVYHGVGNSYKIYDRN